MTKGAKAQQAHAAENGRHDLASEDAQQLKHYYHQMLLLRVFEERTSEMYTKAKIGGYCHLNLGEEATIVGLMAALTPDDYIFTNYREHGYVIARGAEPGAVMAELFGKETGVSKGRGGSMHLFDAKTRLFGGNAIVGGGLPLAVGLALADRMQGAKRVTACFFGDGAMAEGVFHESANLAVLWKLPVLFCCENNLYAMGTAVARYESETDLCVKAAAYGMEALEVDGQDIVAVHEATKRARQRIAEGGAPIFLEYKTYRFRAHSMFDPDLYRDKREIEEWKTRGPLHTFTARLKSEGKLTEEQFLALDAKVGEEVERAVAFAEAAAWEPVEDLGRDVYTPRTPT